MLFAIFHSGKIYLVATYSAPTLKSKHLTMRSGNSLKSLEGQWKDHRCSESITSTSVSQMGHLPSGDGL